MIKLPKSIEKIRKWGASKLTIDLMFQSFYSEYAWMDCYHVRLMIPDYTKRDYAQADYVVASAHGLRLEDVLDKIENKCSEFLIKYPCMDEFIYARGEFNVGSS